MSDCFSSFPIISIDHKYYLRQPKISDANDALFCYEDKLITKFTPDECIPNNVTEAEHDLLRLSNMFDYGQSIYWVIARRDTNQFIGRIGFHSWDRFNNRAEISYQLSSRYWRNGIMYRSLISVLDFAFNQMKIIRVEATTVLDNHSSIGLLLKAGFIQEGRLAQYKFYKGKHVDILIFGITHDMYNNINISEQIKHNPIVSRKNDQMTYCNRYHLFPLNIYNR